MRYRYRVEYEMKDSGIEWIGQIPKQWEIKRNKNLFKINKTLVGTRCNEYRVLSLTLKGVIERDLTENAGKIPATFEGYQIIDKNTLLLCLFDMDVTPRISGYVPQKGIVSPAYTNITSINNELDIRFYSYWFLTMDSEKILLSQSKSLRNTLTNDNFMNIRVIVPALIEQQKIAKFLDEKIAQFDSLISKKESLIQKLEEAKKSLISEVVTGKVKVVKIAEGYELVERKKGEMKDSGVEWLGEIPKEWDIVKAKTISKIFVPQRNKPNLNTQKLGIPWITTEDLNNDIIEIKEDGYYVKNEDIEMAGSKKLPSNSIITTCVGTFGVTGINLEEVIINQQLQAFTDLKINIHFFNYFLNVNAKYFESIATETTIKYVNRDKFENLKIPKPCNAEQSLIAQYLSSAIKSNKVIVGNIRLQIRKLKEAKQSLISEAVTGKIEILD